MSRPLLPTPLFLPLLILSYPPSPSPKSSAMAPSSATNERFVLVPVVLVKLREALLVARVDAVHKAPAHQHLRAILDETSLQLG